MVSVFNGIYYYVNNTRIASLITSSSVVKNSLDTSGVPLDLTSSWMLFGIGPYPQKPPECSSPHEILYTPLLTVRVGECL